MRLVRLAKKYGVRLRRTSVRVGKLALMKHQRYAHAKRFKRARRSLRRLQTYIGRIIRDVGPQDLPGRCTRADVCHGAHAARQVCEQQQRQRGHKIYSLHAKSNESERARHTGPMSLA
jgi:transposase, IS5 family